MTKQQRMIDFGPDYHPEFEGFVFEVDGGIYISFIESKEPGRGHFSRYLQELKQKYKFIKVPTPFAQMRAICLKKGFSETHEYSKDFDEEVELLLWQKESVKKK
jgi:hypothetical protein